MSRHQLPALFAFATAALAQPTQFDWLVCNTSGSRLQAYRQNGTMSLNLALPAVPSFVIMDSDNEAWLVIAGGQLLRVQPGGGVATVAPAVTALVGVDLDEDGNYVAVGGNTPLGGVLYRITPGGTATTIATGLVTPNNLGSPQGVRWVVDSGDYIVGCFQTIFGGSDPSVLRVTRSGVKTTVTSFLLNTKAIDHDPVSGNHIAAHNNAVSRVTPGGMTSLLFDACSNFQLMTPRGIAVTPTGHPVGGGRLGVVLQGNTVNPPCTLPFAGAALCTYNLTTGGIISTIVQNNMGCTAGFCPTSVGVHQGRGLSGAGTGGLGTTYQLRLRLPSIGYAGKFYLISGSLGIRPGFSTADGRLVGLVPDALYFLTTLNQVPAIWQSFQGSLDASGDANAGVLVLNDPVILGLRTFYAFAVVDAAFPSAIQYISNTHAFSIRP